MNRGDLRRWVDRGVMRRGRWMDRGAMRGRWVDRDVRRGKGWIEMILGGEEGG